MAPQQDGGSGRGVPDHSSHAPIFILGISQRSGTNFLFDLLCLHPDCGAPSHKWEDFLIDKSDTLVRYVNSFFPGWRRRGADPELEAALYEHLGNGLVSALMSSVKAPRLVTKTPSVRNLENFFKFFPRAYLLILIRDGHAVVESRVRSFGESYEFAMRKWREGADVILRFIEPGGTSHPNCLVLRYEDLWSQPEQELRKIFATVGLNPNVYDFNAAVTLPVRGSSSFHGTDEQHYHWKPVTKTDEFDPVSRARNWGQAQHERFAWIAGDQLARLGYEDEECRRHRTACLVRNGTLDSVWQLKQFTRTTIRVVKEALKRAFGEERMSRYRRSVVSISGNLAKGRRAFSKPS